MGLNQPLGAEGGQKGDPEVERSGGGESGIRTHGPLAGTRDFQSRPIGLSGISPREEGGGPADRTDGQSPLVKSLVNRRLNGWPEQCGGEGGIRTHDRVAPILVFETSAFNHSATSPQNKIIA